MPSAVPPWRTAVAVHRRALPLLAALLAAAALVPAAAQEPAGEVYFDRVDVDIVDLEVLVSDRDGRPVAGLTREDFELRVDGRPTPIRNFYATGPAPVPGPEVAAPAPGDAPPEAVDPAPGPPSGHPSTLVVMVDNRHATPGERKRVLERLAARFRAGLPPATRTMVVSLEARFQVRLPLTDDREAVATTLEGLLGTAAAGYGPELEFQQIARTLSGGGGGGDALFAIRAYEARQLSQLGRTLDQIGRLIASLGGLPGHKALLYVGRGLNVAPGRALFAAYRERFPVQGPGAHPSVPTELDLAAAAAETAPWFSRIAEIANANRVSFYAVSTGAVGTGGTASAEMVDPIGWQGIPDSYHRADLNAGLAIVADSTGGRALSGSAKYDLVADWLAADAQHLYSLGFAAPEGPADRAHAVEVRVRGRDDVRLRYRRQVVTRSPVRRAIDRTLAKLVYGEGDNPLGVVVTMEPSRPGEDGTVVQPVLVRVPFALLTLLPTGASHDGELDLYVVAEDEEGRVSEVATLKRPVRVPDDRLEAALAGVAGYRLDLAVRPGRQRIAVGVRDVRADVVSTVVVEHEVADPRPAGRRGR